LDAMLLTLFMDAAAYVPALLLLVLLILAAA
jgi:hypothetical protein